VTRGLAYFRIVLGLFAWFAPRVMNRAFGVRRADDSGALDYMNRVFGVRAVALGLGYLTAADSDRRRHLKLWLMCDAADTVMGARMVARRQITPLTSAQALAITGGAAAIDVAALARG
jgi:hypothetical protein